AGAGLRGAAPEADQGAGGVDVAALGGDRREVVGELVEVVGEDAEPGRLDVVQVEVELAALDGDLEGPVVGREGDGGEAEVELPLHVLPERGPERGQVGGDVLEVGLPEDPVELEGDSRE